MYLLLSPIAIAFPSLKIGRTQSAAVKGVLTCNGKAASNVKVTLYDADSGLDVDDYMDKGITDAEGRFLLKGHEVEIMNIDPKLTIYHNCNNEHNACLKKLIVFIPDSFVSDGLVPKKTFDLGIVNLARNTRDEQQECIN
ncbi:unnamed protein product [Thelazia callipaeda]|uniref:Transthyretin-like family protein n=1 Tax=Thelazia callipaeda TaxID=103827 RepID=A0A0N5CZQ4_THECL|nr:unnamed protein product [Thelazia callipaeda]